MRKIFIILALGCLTSHVFSQQKDCTDLKNGKFKTISEGDGSPTFITRKGNRQVEVNESAQFKAEFKIEWTSECTYTLQPTKIYSKGKLQNMQYSDIITVKITGINEQYYTFTATSNIHEGEVLGKVYFDK